MGESATDKKDNRYKNILEWNTYSPETGEMLVDNRVCRRRMAFIWFKVSPWVGLVALLSELSLLLSMSAAVGATFRLVDVPTILLKVVAFLFSSLCKNSRFDNVATDLAVPCESFNFIVSTFCEMFWTRSLILAIWLFAFSRITIRKEVMSSFCFFYHRNEFTFGDILKTVAIWWLDKLTLLNTINSIFIGWSLIVWTALI